MRIVIVGRAASGKDFLKKRFVDKGFTTSISYTTRPPRSTEKDGVDYHFVSVETFQALEKANQFLETDCFNGWYYGTNILDFKNGHIFIMTPRGVNKIPEKYRKTSMVIYLDIDESVRKERLMLRSDADSVDRRLEADRKDFEGFTNYDSRFTNWDF